MYARFHHQLKPTGINDLWIAACCLVYGLPLVTESQRFRGHQQRVPSPGLAASGHRFLTKTGPADSPARPRIDGQHRQPHLCGKDRQPLASYRSGGTTRTGSALQAREGAQLPAALPNCPVSEQPSHRRVRRRDARRDAARRRKRRRSRGVVPRHGGLGLPGAHSRSQLVSPSSGPRLRHLDRGAPITGTRPLIATIAPRAAHE